MAEPQLDSTLHALVTSAPIPLVLIDLRRRVVVDVSEPMLALLQTSRREVAGRPVSSFSAKPAETAALLDLLVDGRLDGYQTNRKLLRGDGAVVATTIWARILDPERGRTHALLVVGAASGADHVPATSLDGPTVIGVVDERWRVTSLSRDIQQLLGVDPGRLEGVDVFAGIHRSDHADLLIATAAVITEQRTTSVRLRVRHRDGRWIRVRLQIALNAGGPPWTYSFTMTPVAANEDGDAGRLEDHLRRIALEVRAAGIARFDGACDPYDDELAPVVDELSERQWEIVSRLHAGERVPDIARALYLSPSTVRNHLSAVFARFGVHSQAELLRRLRAGKDTLPTRP